MKVNITWEDLTAQKQDEIMADFVNRKLGDADEIDYYGENGDYVLGTIEIESI
jgi:hypothetical protein